jgi:hypothetical protein
MIPAFKEPSKPNTLNNGNPLPPAANVRENRVGKTGENQHCSNLIANLILHHLSSIL